jgi:glycosyltransferase involved in cell wall biosynthesis
MRIAIDISYLQTKRAGYGHHTTELLNSLLQYGGQHSYTLWGWSSHIDKNALALFSQPNIRIKAARIPGFIKRVYWNNIKFPDIQIFTGDFDVFHCIEPLMPPAKKKKVIITVHDLAYKKYPEYFTSSVKKWDKHIGQNVLNADAIIVQSQQTKDDLIELFNVLPDKIKTISLPVNSIFHANPYDCIKSEIRKKYNLLSPFALFVGTLEPRKNIPNLIKAFERLHKSNISDLNLVIVGKRGWLYNEIISSINNSTVRNKICYLDYTPEKNLAVIYRLATFFIYPSFYEGYGVPVLEAMASGTPVITSNTSSLKEIAEGASILIDPINVEELADAMFRLSNDQSLREELRKKGLGRIKLFTHKSAANKILDIYKQLS